MTTAPGRGGSSRRDPPRLGAPGPAQESFALTHVEGHAHRLTDVRRQFVAWLATVGVVGDLADDVVLAVYEAMANAAEHAYASAPGHFDVDATRSPGTLVVVVQDQGRWVPPSDPGFRGRGLIMIRAAAHEATVDGAEDGTTVRMRWSVEG